MASTEQYFETKDTHPIDVVETLATSRAWSFDRMDHDQITMEVEGAWRTYSLTLLWSEFDETLRMICSYEMAPPADRMGEFYHVVNLANDRTWAGHFAYWEQSELMIYRYGLVLAGDAVALPDQVDQMMHNAVAACEQYYPAFQLVLWGGEAPEQAMKTAIAQAYGRA